MSGTMTIRDVAASDYEPWLTLWNGYNAFYGRSGPTALPAEVTQTTWQRFFDPAEPVFGLVAEQHGKVAGLAHYVLHRSLTRIEPVCYLSDLYTDPARRSQGIGRALVEAVCAQARVAGLGRVYWQTHETNAAGRSLYDRVATHHGFIVYSRAP